MMLNPELLNLIEKAKSLKANQLHLIAGKKPVIRVEEKIREIADEDVMHVRDIEEVMKGLLTNDECCQLQEDGYIVVEIQGQQDVTCHIAKSLGSYTLYFDILS